MDRARGYGPRDRGSNPWRGVAGVADPEMAPRCERGKCGCEARRSPFRPACTLQCVGMKSGHISSYTVDGVFQIGTRWSVIDGVKGTEVYSAFWLWPKLKCRIWGLLHGYGWLPVR